MCSFAQVLKEQEDHTEILAFVPIATWLINMLSNTSKGITKDQILRGFKLKCYLTDFNKIYQIHKYRYRT